MTLTRVTCVLALAVVSLFACSSKDSSTSGGGTTQQQPPPTTQTIGTAGGTISASGVTLTIPAGALSSDTQITITPNAAPIPAGYTGVSSLYAFEPNGTVFLAPVTVDFTLASPSATSSVFWSNASGGFDALATTMSATDATASIMHFSEGFVGDAQADDSDAGTDGSVDDSSTNDAATEAGTGSGSITANVDGVATTFATSPSVSYVNGASTIQANDNASSTYWQIQITLTTIMQQVCSSSSVTRIDYTHYTSGVLDQTFSSSATQGYCSFIVTSTAYAAGDHATGTFTGGVDKTGGDHLLTNGTFDLIR